MKGFATVRLVDGTVHRAEVHRYEGHRIGRKEFKIKFPLIGLRLLDYFLEWAKQAGFEAVTVKATPVPHAVMAFMGGHPPEAYLARGFEVFSSVVDSELRDVVKDRQLVSADADLDSAAHISYCVKFF